MKKETFTFESRDGQHKLYAVRYLPEEAPKAVFQIVHGMAEHVERYEALAAFLTERGYLVTGEDHLGHGHSVTENDTFGYFCEQDPATVVVRDVHRLKKMTQEEFPGIPYFILGHSMGSYILRNYLCRYGSGIDGAIIMGTGTESRSAVEAVSLLAGCLKLIYGDRHVSRLLAGLAMGDYKKRIPNPRTQSDWLSRDPAVIDAYMKDPLCGKPFTVNGYRTMLELVLRLYKPENLEKIPKELPILIVSGEEDPVGDYGSGVKKAYDSLLNAGLGNIRLKLYPGDRHEILNEPDRREVYEDIAEWLDGILQ